VGTEKGVRLTMIPVRTRNPKKSRRGAQLEGGEWPYPSSNGLLTWKFFKHVKKRGWGRGKPRKGESG